MAANETRTRRLHRELQQLKTNSLPGINIDDNTCTSSLETGLNSFRPYVAVSWVINVEGATGTLYEGEQYQLQFKFPAKYPFDSPQVIFVGSNIPIHPHIYSNGHICLSILTDDWSPALSVQSVCLSVLSMLSSCKEKKLPPDNEFYVKTCSKNPKKTRWWYHDDTV